MTKTMRHQTYIAGVKFRPGAAEVLADLDRETATFDLELEPTNEYDPNAVKILAENGMHVGYVPKDLAPEIGNLIRAGRISKCCVRPGSKSGTGIEIHYTEEETVE